MPISLSTAFLESDALKRSVDREAARNNLALAAITRIDNVVRSIGALQKSNAALLSSLSRR